MDFDDEGSVQSILSEDEPEATEHREQEEEEYENVGRAEDVGDGSQDGAVEEGDDDEDRQRVEPKVCCLFLFQVFFTNCILGL